MRQRKLLAVVGVLVLTAACRAFARDGLEDRELAHAGRERTYHVHWPRTKDPVPLVLVLHGGGGKATRMSGLVRGRWNELADREGFAVVYPQGFGNHWNDGRDGLTYEAHREDVDDVGFIASVVEAVARERPIDRKRVYATGISNGAMMSFRLALERPDLVAAIAPVVGLFPAALASSTPTRGVPTIAFFGTEDPLVPFAGGNVHFGRRQLGKVLSAGETGRLVARWNGVAGDPTEEALPDRDPEDGTRIRRLSWGRDVVVHVIDGGGHTWPGGRPYLPEFVIGKTSRDIDACDAIWEFFKARSRAW